MDSPWFYAILMVFYNALWLTHLKHSAASRPTHIVNVLYFILVILSTNLDLDILLILTLGVPSFIPLLYALGDTYPVSGLTQITAVDEGRIFDTHFPNTGHSHVTRICLPDIFSRLITSLQHSFPFEDPYDTRAQLKPAGVFSGSMYGSSDVPDEDGLDLEQGRNDTHTYDKYEFSRKVRTHEKEGSFGKPLPPKDIHDSIDVLRTYLPQLALSDSDNLLFSSSESFKSSTVDIISNSIRDVQNLLGASAPSTDATLNEDIVALFDKSFHMVSPSISIVSSPPDCLGEVTNDWAHEEQVEEQDCVGDISTWDEDLSMDIKNLLTAQDMSVVTDIDTSFITSPAPLRSPPNTRIYEEDSLSPSSSSSSFSVFGYNDSSLSFDLPEFPPSESEQNISVSLTAIMNEESISRTQNQILDIDIDDEDFGSLPSCAQTLSPAPSILFSDDGCECSSNAASHTYIPRSLPFSGSSCSSLNPAALIDAETSFLLDVVVDAPQLKDDGFSRISCIAISADSEDNSLAVCCVPDSDDFADLSLSSGSSYISVNLSFIVDADASLLLDADMSLSELGNNDFTPSLSIIMSMDGDCPSSMPAWSPNNSVILASSISGSCSSVNLSVLLDLDASLLLGTNIDVPTLDDGDFGSSPSITISGNLSDTTPACLVSDHNILALASFPSSSSNCSSVNLSLVVNMDTSLLPDASIDVPVLEAADFSSLQSELVEDDCHADKPSDLSLQGAALSSNVSTSPFVLMDNCANLILDAELEQSEGHEVEFSSLFSAVTPSASFDIPIPSTSYTWLMDVELDLNIGSEDDFLPLPTPAIATSVISTDRAPVTTPSLRKIPLPPLPSPYTPSSVYTTSPPKNLLQEILESSDLSSLSSPSPFALGWDRLPSLSPSSSISSISTLDSPFRQFTPSPFARRKACTGVSALEDPVAFEGLSRGPPSPYFWRRRVGSRMTLPKGAMGAGHPVWADVAIGQD